MGINSKRKITWYCGEAWEPWSPKSLERGLAGSQSAVVYLSREWAKLGYEVTVYNHCSREEGIYEDVKYVSFDKFDIKQDLDILIIWRDRNLCLLDEPIKAQKILLELHDVPYKKREFSKERLKKVDKIIVRSKFHYKQFMRQPWFSRDNERKFIIITNGADKRWNRLDNAKSSYKLIYNAEYTRGLEQMLRYGWPLIKKKIPQTELYVYYGWDHFDSYKKDEKSQTWKKEMIRLMKELDVIDHGRVSLSELMEAKSKSAIHYYGCIWPELDCISIRESALAGCVPVTTKYAALAEKPYCIKVSGEPERRRTQEKLAYKIIKLLEKPRRLEKIRKKIKKKALKESWDVIAQHWIKEFNQC